jgi:hypothetical protein
MFYDADGSAIVDVDDLYAWHGAPVDLTGEGAATALDARHLAWCIRADEIADMEAPR